MLALLPLGCIAAQIVWAVTHHRYDSPNAGYYYGSVHGRFFGNDDDETYFFTFDGKTQPQWRWTYFTNFSYRTLQFEWRRFDGGPDEIGDKGVLSLPSFAYQSQHSTGVLTRARLSEWLLGVTNATQAESPSVAAVFDFIEAAGTGTLPPPKHHGYHFEAPGRGSIQHFQLGFGVGGLVFVWVGIWLLLAVLIGRRILRPISVTPPPTQLN